MAPLGFTALAFIVCAQLPAKGLRRSRKAVQQGTDKQHTEPEMQAFAMAGEDDVSPSEVAAVVEDPHQVDWKIGDIVGWVGEGTQGFPIGGHARILSFFQREGTQFAYVHYLNNATDILPSCNRQTTGTCWITDCNPSRNAYCGTGYQCFCHPGTCASGGACYTPRRRRTPIPRRRRTPTPAPVSCDGFALIPINENECPPDPNLSQCHVVQAGQLCDGDGECSTNSSLNNCGSSDIYRKVPNEEVPFLPTSEMYQVNVTENECEGGSHARFVGPTHNTGNILGGQVGIVQAFSIDGQTMNWWDIQQGKGFAIPSTWLRCRQGYWPQGGNGAWVGLHSVNAGTITIREMIGTAKTLSETETSIWANELSSTLSKSMKVGVGFMGGGIEVGVGGELSETLRDEQSTTQAYSWTMNVEQEYELTLPPDSGYLWQWHIRTQLESGEVYTSRTRNFALTAGLFERPRCVPGYQTDGAPCQVCYTEESKIQGLPPIKEDDKGSAASNGLLFGPLIFGLLHPVLQA